MSSSVYHDYTHLVEQIGITKLINNKIEGPGSLKEDVEEYVSFLNQAKDFENEMEPIFTNQYGSVVKRNLASRNNSEVKAFLMNIEKQTLLKNKTEVFNFLVSHLNKSYENEEYLFLSPSSALTDDIKIEPLESLVDNVHCTEPDYLNDVNVTPFGFIKSETNDSVDLFRPAARGKLILSPETSKCTGSSSLSSDSYNSLHGKKDLFSVDTHSLSLMKFDMWFYKFKSRKKHKIQEKIKKCINSDMFKKLSTDYNDHSLSSLEFSKFFVPNNNKYLYDDAMLNNKAYTSRHCILRETPFDRTLINFHHNHFLQTREIAPNKCDSCVNFIKEHNLQQNLNSSRYVKHYFIQHNYLEKLVTSSGEGQKHGLFLNNLWSGIKREISLKIKGSYSKSISTVGTLSKNSSFSQETGAKNKICSDKTKVESIQIHNKPHTDLEKEIHKPSEVGFFLSSADKKSFKKLNLNILESQLVPYPIVNSAYSTIDNNQLVLHLLDLCFSNLFLSWNYWYWSLYANVKNVESKAICCNFCCKPITDSMESFLFRYLYNHYNNRLCVECTGKKILFTKKLEKDYEYGQYENDDSKTTLVDSV